MGADESGVSVFTLAKSCMTITKLLRSREWKKIKSSDDCQHIMNNREKGTDGLTRVWGMARPTTWEMKRADSVRAASRNEKSICNNIIFWVFDGLWEACSKEAPEIRIPHYLLEFWCGTLIGYRCEPTRTGSVTTQLMSPGLSPPKELAFAKQQSFLFFFFQGKNIVWINLGTGDGGLLEGHMVRTGHGRAEIKPGGSYQTATPSHRVSRHTSNAELPTWYRPWTDYSNSAWQNGCD